MDFIKKLFGGILSLVAGIFRVFNIFKKSEYFLEADTVPSIESAKPVEPQPAKGKSNVVTEPKSVARSGKSESAKPAKPVGASTAAVPVVAVASNPEAVENGKVVQPVAAASNAVAKVDPQPGTTAVVVEPTPIAPTPTDATPAVFAPKYLSAPTGGGRRRPGPSMSRFLDMAKQVKA